MTENILKQMVDELGRMEMRDKIATAFIIKLIEEGNGFWAKTAEQVLIAMNNGGNSNKEEKV